MLGVWDHTVNFPRDWEFVILYGPNGVGKTKLLEAANALTELEIQKLVRIPFDTLQLEYDDGSILEASQSFRTGDEDQVHDKTGSKEDARPDFTVDELRLALRRHGEELAKVMIANPEATTLANWLLANTSWREAGNGLWEDTEDGEVVEFSQLQVRFRHSPTPGSHGSVRIPDHIRDFASSVKSHLIETQRLLLTASRPSRPSRPPGWRRTTENRSTVAEYSEDLKRRLGRALAQNSKTTQQLDRTFPRRILENPAPPHVNDQMIRAKYQEQNELRSRLAGITVIGGEADLPLPQRKLEDWERHVLWTSLNDTDAKLSSFEEILQRITLLEDIINRRFHGKKISVNSEDGLRIRTSPDDRTIAPENLSSGEQHELILMYDFLLNAQQGTTVLIDEPEISLHVAWQQQFLEDIAQIAKVSSLRFIVATHSPQIIHKWWDRTVQLGPDAEQ
jgi:energy-coupling factor transporter ATP-binding protein EcfA2